MTNYEWLIATIEDFKAHPHNRCMPWPFSKAGQGYGQLVKGDKRFYAHRLSYEVYYGKKLKKSGCHRCDRRACINPLHVYDGSPRQNTRDAYERERFVGSGEFKLRKEDVGKVIDMLNMGERQTDIAAKFGITQGMVSHIKNGRSWSFLPDLPEVDQDTKRRRRRQARGSKLTMADVRDIRQVLDEDELSQAAIADLYNVSIATISRIKNGSRWS